MKKYLSFIIIVLFLSTQVSAQLFTPHQDEGNLAGGFGLTWINNQPFYNLHLTPEFAFSNFGLGIDLNLEFDSSGKLRGENFKTFSDYLRIIRYFRYGYKGDPVYFKVGVLNHTTIGHGNIMEYYNNSPSYDARKNGAVLDVDFNNFGFETVYSNFLQADIIGLRGYVRPLKFTSYSAIPIISKLEIGASYFTDLNSNVGAVAGTVDTAGNFISSVDRGSLSIYSFDAGLPILRAGMLNIDLFFDYTKIINYGSGTAYGIKFNLKGLGLLDAEAKFVRRVNTEQYIPSYFNSFYELDRFNFNTTTGAVTSRLRELENSNISTKGWFGELYVSLLGTFDIIGSYQRLDEIPNSGELHLAANVLPEGVPFILRAGYDKTNIGNETGIFTLDERSNLHTEIGYKINSYLAATIYYRWTFLPIRDADDNIIDFQTQKRVEPRLTFVYPFDMGGK